MEGMGILVVLLSKHKYFKDIISVVGFILPRIRMGRGGNEKLRFGDLTIAN